MLPKHSSNTVHALYHPPPPSGGRVGGRTHTHHIVHVSPLTLMFLVAIEVEDTLNEVLIKHGGMSGQEEVD